MSNEFDFCQRDLSQLPDYTTDDGAKVLVDRIKAVWEAKGFTPPDVKAEKPPYGSHAQGPPRFDVRSDMVNGFPKQARG